MAEGVEVVVEVVAVVVGTDVSRTTEHSKGRMFAYRFLRFVSMVCVTKIGLSSISSLVVNDVYSSSNPLS